MNFSKLLQINNKPKLYTPGNAFMWSDPYIGKHLLKTHLDREIDLASRKHSQIIRTTEWIMEQTNKSSMEILDLGCGPGLYAEILAEKGHHVTGVDISSTSIEYARESADKKGLSIKYHALDYLAMEPLDSQYDLILMIFTDFCALTPKQRNRLLEFTRNSLKPGGVFIFDILRDTNLKQRLSPSTWEISDSNGFWNNDQYLALSNSFLYEEDKVILYQHTVLQNNKEEKVYRFWTHFFSRDDIRALLEDHLFIISEISDQVLFNDDEWSGEHVLFCVAEKNNGL